MKDIIDFRYFTLSLYTGITFGIVYNRDFTVRNIIFCIPFFLLAIKLPIPNADKRRNPYKYIRGY